MAFLAALKRETTECHVALEQSLDILRRVKTVEDYRALLVRFFTIYAPLERALGRAVDWPSRQWDFVGRLKTPWLRKDLLALGLSDRQIEEQIFCSPPEIEGLGLAVGSLYVLEGATLGGQMLAQQFRRDLGVTPETGGAFFTGYGEKTMTRWREFGTWADAQAAAAGGGWDEPAFRGARETFDAFSRWLT